MATPPGSAPYQLAENLFGAAALSRVLFFGDRARLPPQLKTKDLIFQRIQTRTDSGIDLSKTGRC